MSTAELNIYWLKLKEGTAQNAQYYISSCATSHFYWFAGLTEQRKAHPVKQTSQVRTVLAANQ